MLPENAAKIMSVFRKLSLVARKYYLVHSRQPTATLNIDSFPDSLDTLFSLTNLLGIRRPSDDRLKKTSLFNGKKYYVGAMKNSIQSYLYEVGSTSIDLCLCGEKVNFSEEKNCKLLEAYKSDFFENRRACDGDYSCGICLVREEVETSIDLKSDLRKATQEGVPSIPTSCDSNTNGEYSYLGLFEIPW